MGLGEQFEPEKTGRVTETARRLVRVRPVINHSVRILCIRPYPGHPKGCPNANKKEGCPPTAPLFDHIYDMRQPVYAVVNEFNLDAHAIRMRGRHPEWSIRQLVCCLYWQPKARRQLTDKISTALSLLPPGYEADRCPEAGGVDVTKTLADVGVSLEWPPRFIARQVALLATRCSRE